MNIQIATASLAVVLSLGTSPTAFAAGHGPVFGSATPTLGWGGWSIDQAWTVRQNVQVVEGQRPASGQPEVCVGKRLTSRFPHTGVGQTLRFAGRDWKVTCHFTAAGSAFESEVWGENEQLMPVFRGPYFQSITFRLKDPAAFDDARRALQDDKRMTVDAHREYDFYAQQSQLLGSILTKLA